MSEVRLNNRVLDPRAISRLFDHDAPPPVFEDHELSAIIGSYASHGYSQLFGSYDINPERRRSVGDFFISMTRAQEETLLSGAAHIGPNVDHLGAQRQGISGWGVSAAGS